MQKLYFKILLFFFLTQYCAGQNNLSISDLNKALGRGINMGNMFEAPSEAEWGNPFKDDYFQKIASLGFNHVRIPIRWDVPARCIQASPYTINPDFFARIKFVIDNAITNKLMVIINMHHHEGLFADPAKDKEKFLAQWTQISAFFKGYDQKLLFEVMNEPHDNLSPNLWNTYFNDALQVIRKTNPTRAVLMGTANYGGLGSLTNLKVPNDKNIIVTIHYYNPFNFTHQGADWVSGSNAWLGTKWEDLQAERNQVTSEFDPVTNPTNIKDFPINIGEFGAFSTADIESRVRWTTYLARWFEKNNWSWAYWEFSAGFGIYDPKTSQTNAKLVDALLKNPLPEPKKQTVKAVYQSDFNAGNDGWNIALQPSSDATLSKANNTLNIDVKTSVANAWHIQMTKLNFALTKSKRYQVTVKASATNPTTVTCYLGKNADPYNSYSGYPSMAFGTTEKEFTYTFVMNDPTDLATRMSFDMGLSISKITISSIKLEELLDDNSVFVLQNEKEIDESIKISPNPTSGFVNLTFDKNVQSIEIFDERGKLITDKINDQKDTNFSINLTNNSAGLYFVYFKTYNFSILKKIVKD